MVYDALTEFTVLSIESGLTSRPMLVKPNEEMFSSLRSPVLQTVLTVDAFLSAGYVRLEISLYSYKKVVNLEEMKSWSRLVSQFMAALTATPLQMDLCGSVMQGLDCYVVKKSQINLYA